MRYRRRLVKFMKKKAEWLSDVLEVEPQLYFTVRDEKEIMEVLTENTAAKIWDKLFETIYDHGEEGIKEENCPFCIWIFSLRKSCCCHCGYGGRHGVCRTERSDMELIREAYERNDLRMSFFPSNERYREWVEEILKEEKEEEDTKE